MVIGNAHATASFTFQYNETFIVGRLMKLEKYQLKAGKNF